MGVCVFVCIFREILPTSAFLSLITLLLFVSFLRVKDKQKKVLFFFFVFVGSDSARLARRAKTNIKFATN